MGRYSNIELGVGLLKLGGRTWGGSNVGSHYSPEKFLWHITRPGRSQFLDTAPAYAPQNSDSASSERVLGNFLKRHRILRQRLTIATKFGEHMVDGQSIVDHTEKGLRESLDQSMKLLGSAPDVLFIHKTHSSLFDDAAKKKDVDTALRYAKRRGVGALGASVSDVPTAMKVLADKRFRYIQFPLNEQKRDFEPVLEHIRGDRSLRRRMIVVINRPFGEGQIVRGLDNQAKNEVMDRAFSYIRDQVGHRVRTVILTGASSFEHYSQNRRSLQRVLQ